MWLDVEIDPEDGCMHQHSRRLCARLETESFPPEALTYRPFKAINISPSHDG